ncbi:acyltransferase family protein [Colwellia sp. TT2012]|uniref:acyltransferase family protein n=1 Tax=Colwellia sp. TT2012 TaxID=1720342 RepID=UPI00070B15DE|nr:acyltransferase family protein [Colwellia sp. TT2012]
MKNNKHQWIDIVKGIGILTIVIGHITDGILREILFLFHVPLFFFLSGYLFKQPQELKSFINKKTNALLIPYASFLMVFSSLLLLKEWLKTHEINIALITDALWGGQALTGELSVFWFITSLFLTQIVFALIATVANKKVLSIIMLISLLLAYIAEPFMQDKSYFWAVNTVLYALPFYYAGYLYKQFNTSVTSIINHFCIVYTVLFFIAFSLMPEIFYIDIKYSNLGMPIISFVLSLTVTVVIFIVAQKTSDMSHLAKPFVMLGGMSMTIMYLHQPLQITVKHGFNLDNQFFLILLTILFSIFCHYMLSRTRLSRQYFFGGK